jgi:hypothetical protein
MNGRILGDEARRAMNGVCGFSVASVVELGGLSNPTGP